MRWLVRAFYRVGYWIVPWWYGFTAMATRKRRYPEVRRYDTAADIVRAIEGGKRWRQDPIFGLLDVVMSPRKFQDRIYAQAVELGDCDDFALYWCTALLRSGLADRAWFSTLWYQAEGARGVGHVVAVFELEGRRYWADYGLPRPVTGEWGWADDVATRRGAQCVAAAMTEIRLRRGEPRFRKRYRVRL